MSLLQYAGGEWLSSGKTELLSWSDLPFSSPWAPLMGAIFYFLQQVVIRALLSKPVHLKTTMALYNLGLTVGSAALFTVLSVVIWDVYNEYGFEGVWNDPNWILPNTKVAACCYIFYVSKYIELLDTAFLVARQKPVRLVQKWHHVSVLFLFWSYMQARMFNHWVLVWANTFAHIFVYGYFFCSTVGIRVPLALKNSITFIQIGQFVLDMAYSMPFPILKLQGRTPGEWGPWVLGQFIGLTFIVLFTQVLLSNRRKAAARNVKRAAGKPKAE